MAEEGLILGIGTWLEILIAIVLYMVAYTFTTEILKPILKVEGGRALLLSWIVGIVFLILIGLSKWLVIRPETILLFIFITGITNEVYAKWEGLRSFIRKALKREV